MYEGCQKCKTKTQTNTFTHTHTHTHSDMESKCLGICIQKDGKPKNYFKGIYLIFVNTADLQLKLLNNKNGILYQKCQYIDNMVETICDYLPKIMCLNFIFCETHTHFRDTSNFVLSFVFYLSCVTYQAAYNVR